VRKEGVKTLLSGNSFVMQTWTRVQTNINGTPHFIYINTDGRKVASALGMRKPEKIRKRRVARKVVMSLDTVLVAIGVRAQHDGDGQQGLSEVQEDRRHAVLALLSASRSRSKQRFCGCE
jgi:hypothetical protein